jgi:hypothetical protein
MKYFFCMDEDSIEGIKSPLIILHWKEESELK